MSEKELFLVFGKTLNLYKNKLKDNLRILFQKATGDLNGLTLIDKKFLKTKMDNLKDKIKNVIELEELLSELEKFQIEKYEITDELKGKIELMGNSLNQHEITILVNLINDSLYEYGRIQKLALDSKISAIDTLIDNLDLGNIKPHLVGFSFEDIEPFNSLNDLFDYIKQSKMPKVVSSVRFKFIKSDFEEENELASQIKYKINNNYILKQHVGEHVDNIVECVLMRNRAQHTKNLANEILKEFSSIEFVNFSKASQFIKKIIDKNQMIIDNMNNYLGIFGIDNDEFYKSSSSDFKLHDLFDNKIK